MATMINRAGTTKFDLEIEESDREYEDNDCQPEEQEICPDHCSECSEYGSKILRRRSSNIPSHEEEKKAN